MSTELSADVAVPVYRDLELTRACLRSVLEHSGPALGRLFAVNDCSPEPQMRALLDAFRREDPRVRVLETERNQGFVAAANLGLAASERDCVLLNSDARVTPGWLDELTRALAEVPEYAALSPLSNNATMCSVPNFGAGVPIASLEGHRLDLSGLPRVTSMPTTNGFCLLLRRSVVRELGLFDRKFGLGYNEENDWCQRARAAGHLVGRANRALVFHHGSGSFGHQARKRLDVVNERRLVARYPSYLADNARFEAGPYARLAARAVRAQLGLLRVRCHVETAADLERARALARTSRCRVDVVTVTLARACEEAGLQLSTEASASEPPDVELVSRPVPVPQAHVVVTVLEDGARLDAPGLQEQLEWSQAVIGSGEGGRLAELILDVARRPNLEALERQRSTGTLPLWP